MEEGEHRLQVPTTDKVAVPSVPVQFTVIELLGEAPFMIVPLPGGDIDQV
jgi:hypothetical protein